MKATGIVRKVDELGRFVLPMELRRELGIEPRDGVEIFVDGEDIIIQKYRPRCVFCGGHEELTDFRGRLVCHECRSDIRGRTSGMQRANTREPSEVLPH